MKRFLNLVKRFAVVICLSGTAVTDLQAGDFIESSGTAITLALPLVAGGLTLHHDDPEGLTQLGKSMAFSVATSYGLKNVINERRPNGDKHSFPSAHTSISVTAADFIVRRYGPDLGIPAFVAAGFVGYSRIESSQHHWYDVLAGAAIGVIGNGLFTSHVNGCDMNVSVLPGEDGFTALLSYAL